MNFKKNIFWFSFGNVIYLGTQWVITVLVTRNSGLNDAGILSLAMSISATFQTVAFFGMRNYQVSDIQEKYNDLLYIQSRYITCFAALLFCIFFSLINRYQFNQLIAIIFFMLFRLAEAFSDVLHGTLQKNDRLDLVGKGYFYKGILIVPCFMIGYNLFRALNAGLFFMFIGAISITLFYDMRNAKQISPFKINFESKTKCLQLLKETTPLCICVCLQSAISTVPKYILEKMCGEVALGAYSSVFAPAMLVQVAATYIFTPFVGRFSQYYLNQEVNKFKRLFLQISLCIISMGFITVLCAKFIGWKLLDIVFGSIIVGYEYLLIPIIFCTFTNAIFAFCIMLSVVVRDFKGQMIASLLGFLLCTISTVICISNFEINGASYGLLIGTLFCTSVLIVRISLKLSRLKKKVDL